MSGNSESMIERVARAICGENHGDPDMVIGSPIGDRVAWTEFIPEARAAIEAMRGCATGQILAAGWGELQRAHLPRLGPGGGLREAWNAMIDAALSEDEG